MADKIRFGIPKGSLEKATLELFRKAGWQIGGSERSYMLQSDDPRTEFILLRPQTIPKAVERGAIDAGITGKDWIVEYSANTVQTRLLENCALAVKRTLNVGASVVEVTKLQYSKRTSGGVRWALAVPVGSSIKQVSDLSGKVVTTELVNITTNFLAERGVDASVEFSWGATEVLPSIGLADAIVDVTETGASLADNRLRIIGDPVFKSYTVLIANLTAYADLLKRQKIDDIALLLRGALNARDKVGLKMNASKRDLDKILQTLKLNGMYGINCPTIAGLSDPEWVAVEVIVDEEKVRNLMPELKEAGACGIIEYSLNKIIT
jgi:ATP phosphoribosyltransferase